MDVVKNFADLIDYVETKYSFICDEISNADKEEQDLLHEIEFMPFSSHESYILAKKLREVRQRRRKFKEEKEVLSSLHDWLDKNKQIKMSIFKTWRTMKETKERQGNRVYTPRIRTDIKLAQISAAI